MSLNLKGEETHRLARELAVLTGRSMSQAVTQALRDSLERHQGGEASDLAARLLSIGRDCAKRLGEPHRSVEHGRLLYDDKGLPK